MEQSSEPQPCTLLVRHLPKAFTDEEKQDFFFHFGAEAVSLMNSTGATKHCAFVKFPSATSARDAISRLHQLELLGSRLVAEFAKHANKELFPSNTHGKTVKQERKKPESVSEIVNKVTEPSRFGVDENFKRHGIPYPRKARLNYLYPPPTVSTLTNIANALASHPKLYVQVLHLMNKMNLPSPFGSITPTPPLPSEVPTGMLSSHTTRVDVGLGSEPIQDVEMENASSEESEIESDADREQKPKHLNPNVLRQDQRQRKRLKLVQPDQSLVLKPASFVQPGQVFEQTEQMRSAQIHFKIAKEVSVPAERTLETDTMSGNIVLGQGETGDIVLGQGETTGGFGTMTPAPRPTVQGNQAQKADVNYTIDPESFKSQAQIGKGCLTERQLKDFPVFKHYEPGSATCRLYIKNLAKQVREQDLVDLFGGFIDWTDEYSFNAFDIRLMKEGRMKGQAFVTFPSENTAQSVLKHCNAYVLHNKPLVIQFARSAKAKQTDEKK